MTKRQNDFSEGEARRHLMDLQINKMFVQDDIPLGIMPATLQDTSEPDKILGQARALCSTSREMGGAKVRLLHYRFDTDNLYLKLPDGLRDIYSGVTHFSAHFFLPLKIDEGNHITHFHPPIKIGAIPGIVGKPVQQCFWMRESEGNANRMDCLVLKPHELTWLPIDRKPIGLLYPTKTLTQCLQDIMGT